MSHIKKYFLISIVCLCFSLVPIVNAESVPDWVKNTAGWWATDAISETEFVNAIEFLVNEEIILVNVSEISENSKNVPDWVKNTAGWWATDAISETEFVSSISFLINNGIISIEFNCDEIVDKNRNQIPDEIETLPNLNGLSSSQYALIETTFKDRDWSNCKMPNELSFYQFRNINFSNVDFTESNLFSTIFMNSIFVNTNFSDSTLHGTIFALSNIDNVNFSNVDFSPEPFELAIIHFSLYDPNGNQIPDKIKTLPNPNGIATYTHCSFLPCTFQLFHFPNMQSSPIHEKLFGPQNLILNLQDVRQIADNTDLRTIFRLVPSFVSNDIQNTNFYDSDLSHAMFISNDMINIDFSTSEMSKSMFTGSSFENVKFQNQFFSEKQIVELIKNEDKKPYSIYPVPNKKFEENSKFSDVIIKNVIDHPPINWSMGMTLYDDRLFVANTDDHTIDIFETEGYELIQSFSSPLQNDCHTRNTFTIEIDCNNNLRNLPTSVAILDNKIFTAFGFQDEMQIFDLNGNYIKKFGKSGDEQGEFSYAYKMVSHGNEIFVLDSGNNRIQVFDTDGDFIREFLTHEKFIETSNMDIAIYENVVFLMDSSKSIIKKFTLDGKLINTMHFPTISNNSMRSLSVADNLLLIGNSDKKNLQIFNLDGEQILSFGDAGKVYGKFANPVSVLFDGKNIFVSDGENYRIQIFELIP